MNLSTTKVDPVAAQKSRWTVERVQSLSRNELENLRANAERRGSNEVVALCDAELSRRAPAKAPRASKTSAKHSSSDFVAEYHFVCPRGTGVTELPHGRFSTGSWVVDEENVKRSIEHNGLVALHETKATPSYRQGRIAGYSVTERDMVAEAPGKKKTGIEFVVEPTTEPLEWFSNASGEKGYRWQRTVAVLGYDVDGEASK